MGDVVAVEIVDGETCARHEEKTLLTFFDDETSVWFSTDQAASASGHCSLPGPSRPWPTAAENEKTRRTARERAAGRLASDAHAAPGPARRIERVVHVQICHHTPAEPRRVCREPRRPV